MSSLQWRSGIPSEQIQVIVTDGRVTLEGDVEQNLQRQEAERVVRELSGVVSVANQIRIKPRVKPQPDRVKKEIEDAVSSRSSVPPPLMLLFLSGDVMLGRGIDQVLPFQSRPALRESYIRDARTYAELAEERNGRIPRPLGFADPWGKGLEELARVGPDVRIINLETSVTRSDAYWPRKGIHYRMHPGNVPCLTAARIDVCALANNHVLDFGEPGLLETLEMLAQAGVRPVGAGRNLAEAQAPARVDLGNKGPVLVFSLANGSSGVPPGWSAKEDRSGIDRPPGPLEGDGVCPKGSAGMRRFGTSGFCTLRKSIQGLASLLRCGCAPCR